MIVAFSISPSGVGASVAEHVAEAVKVVRASGLPNHTDAMFTTVEGCDPHVLTHRRCNACRILCRA